MSDEKDDILDILQDFREKKQRRDENPLEMPKPPKKREERIDFAKTNEEETDDKDGKKKAFTFKLPKKEKTEESIEKKQKSAKLRRERAAKAKQSAIKILRRIRSLVTSKKFIISAVAIIAAAALICGIIYGAGQARSAYLKPYEEKYPDVEFKVGMLEKYCDVLGEYPDTVGYIEIPDTELSSAVGSKSGDRPYAQPLQNGATRFNYVVYLNDSSLEQAYSSVDLYNSRSQYMTYSDLFSDMTFKIVGAFYTNTDAKDDNGYIFPYNVTEEMTVDSANEYISRLQSRFIYDTGIDITRQDTLLTVSCPSDIMDGFSFVTVGVLRNGETEKTTAEPNENAHYPQSVYDENNTENPYGYSSKWYPEIIITDESGNEKTVKRTAEDYRQK